MLEARAAVRSLHAYRPPLAGRQGLRLDFNESTIGCSPRVLARLRSLDAEALARYPEREPVEAEVAGFLGLDAAQVLLTNGVDEAIHLLCSTYLDPGDEAIIVVPTFAMYAIFAQAEGARVIEVPAGENFAFPLEDLLSRISPRTRLIAVANPNNPTGTAVACECCCRSLKPRPRPRCWWTRRTLSFTERRSFTAPARPANLFVARTFSKAYGLAGLRIGILAGDVSADGDGAPRRFALQRECGCAGGVAGGASRSGVCRTLCREVQRGRELLQQELEALGLHYWPSRANFVLVRVGPSPRGIRSGLARPRNSGARPALPIPDAKAACA